MDNQIVQVARFTLGFSWIYHGLFPKIFKVAPIEKELTAAMGLSEEISYIVTKSAGVLEVVFGLLILVFYKNTNFIWFNIFALVSLCGYVAIMMPVLLIEAFNPVTTNFSLIALSYILLRAKASYQTN